MGAVYARNLGCARCNCSIFQITGSSLDLSQAPAQDYVSCFPALAARRRDHLSPGWATASSWKALAFSIWKSKLRFEIPATCAQGVRGFGVRGTWLVLPGLRSSEL